MVAPGISSETREHICNQIRGILKDNTLLVLDYAKIEDNLKTTQTIFQYFVIFLGVIAFIIAFFMLLVSTTSNIKENMWEFGVLRAIGLRKAQLTRIYLYEALIVFISSALLGLLVGFVLATTLSLQFNIFIELPLTIEFPFLLVSSMLLLGILITVLGTIIPLRAVNKNRTISGILKVAG